MTFLELQDHVIAQVGRPAAEIRELVKLQLNLSQHRAESLHSFKYAEGLANITYPADTFYVELASACDAEIMCLLSLQLVGTTTDKDGYLLTMLDYANLQAKKRLVQDASGSGCNALDVARGFRESTGANQPYYTFLVDLGFGLYPTPSVNIELLAHFIKRLPALVDNDDENFLTTFGYSYLIDQATLRTLWYLKVDSRLENARAIADDSWASLLAWDKRVRSAEVSFG